jgi:hypothetical protein
MTTTTKTTVFQFSVQGLAQPLAHAHAHEHMQKRPRAYANTDANKMKTQTWFRTGIKSSSRRLRAKASTLPAKPSTRGGKRPAHVPPNASTPESMARRQRARGHSALHKGIETEGRASDALRGVLKSCSLPAAK